MDRQDDGKDGPACASSIKTGALPDSLPLPAVRECTEQHVLVSTAVEIHPAIADVGEQVLGDILAGHLLVHINTLTAIVVMPAMLHHVVVHCGGQIAGALGEASIVVAGKINPAKVAEDLEAVVLDDVEGDGKLRRDGFLRRRQLEDQQQPRAEQTGLSRIGD